MSTHAYYSSGERNEQGEWERPEIASFNKAPEPEIVKYPVEFDFSYYASNRDKFSKSSYDYWEWEYFRLYCKAVSEFLKGVANVFSSKFNLPENALNLPDFIKIDFSNYNLENSSRALRDAENKLCAQFYKSPRTLQGKLNRYAYLKKLRDYASKAWVMYYALQDKYLPYALKFKASYENYDLNTDFDVLRAFRGATIMERQTKLNVKPNLLTDKHHNHPDELYQNVDASKLYNDLALTVNAFKIDEYTKILNELKPKISQLKSNPAYRELIAFYNAYDYINLIVYNLNKITKDCCENGHVRYGIFSDFNNVDGDNFKIASDYLDFLKRLKLKLNEPLFISDVESIQAKLEQALSISQDAYFESLS